MRSRLILLGLVFAALLHLGCAGSVGGARKSDAPPLTSSAALCGDSTLEPDDFCLPASRAEALLRDPAAEVLSVRTSYGGFSLPNVVRFRGRDADGEVIYQAKWKVARPDGDAFNNSPRREVAAWVIQRLFLPPSDFVVPPTLVRCIPVEDHRAVIGSGSPTFEDVDCVLVLLAWWVVNTTSDDALSLDDFEEDKEYARALAHLNLFTHLVDHRDTRSANFLRSIDPERPRVLAIDNGVAFEGFKNPFQLLSLRADWSEIRVPALPRDTVERLRLVNREDLDRLAVVAEFRIDEGLAVPHFAGPALDPERGVRHDGNVVQLGLTVEEIDGVWSRLEALLDQIDAGEIDTF